MSLFSEVTPLLRFFDCRETSGEKLHCAKTNTIWDLSGSGFNLVFDTRSGGISSTMDFAHGPVNFSTGTWPTISTNKDYLWVCSGNLTGSDIFRVSAGDVNQMLPEYAGIGAGIGASDNPFHGIAGPHGSGNNIRVEDTANLWEKATTIPAFPYVLAPLDVTVVWRYSGVNNTLLYEAFRNDDGTSLISALTYTDHPDLGDFTPNPCFRFSGIELYALQLWEFSSFPSDIISACLWMGREWAKGRANRTLYPAWAGRYAGAGFST